MRSEDRKRPKAGRSEPQASEVDPGLEWLEADGLGGFASGTVSGIRTRRYHALLLAARTPPTDRTVLVNGFEAWVEWGGRSVALTSQAYLPDVVHPDGASRIESFSHEPWPRWTIRLDESARVEQELFAIPGAPRVAVAWRWAGPAPAPRDAVLCVRPLLSGRDYHALHHENPAFAFLPEERAAGWIWRPYPGVGPVFVRANARYVHEPLWYRSFLYAEERARGLDFSEDLASPGVFRFELGAGPAVCLLAAGEESGAELGGAGEDPVATCDRLRDAERTRRTRFASPRLRAADAYVVRRGAGRTLVAGYPWFTDWGRDTFIALRGLCLATGRLDVANEILLAWSDTVSEGMLPNRFPDRGGAPEFNSVDASLWYAVAVGEYLRRARPTARDRARLGGAVGAILEAYTKGTRFGIRADEDGLLAAGEPGVQLTWMDARVGDWVVTPRIGKPVEVQALWINALRLAAEGHEQWGPLADRATASFRARFWNDAAGALYDVVDVDHRRGTADASFRPNQIFAVGGLPIALLGGERGRRVVDAVEARLWTPLGLRSLAPDHPAYAAHYEGGPLARDAAYHQGTVWPWLAGPFVEAWVRARGATAAAREEARTRFLGPLLAHLEEAGLGHVSEIADGEPPHAPRGCPFQAWSLGELIRLERDVLATP
jgi:predicted glycogen debranching enzyme